MPSLANTSQRDAIIARIEALSPEARGQWGRFSAPQMVAHCADALRMGLGELPCKSKDKAIGRLFIVKWLVFNVLPFPKSAPTADELISRTPAAWDAERANLISLVRRAGEAKELTAEHPFFGPMTTSEWGKLAWKHLDHHLKQFGA